jgi:hypothetical protein
MFGNEDEDIENFVKEVNEAISQGWKPLGGVSCAVSNEGMFVQAMIKDR